MATKKNSNKPVTETAMDTVLGSEYGAWELVQSFTSFDIRRCSNCGKTDTFPRDMSKCIWDKCPDCGMKMRW